MNKLFGDSLMINGMSFNTNDVLENKKMIGIYFSKSNCNACKYVLDDIKSFNKHIKDNNDDVEMIFPNIDIREDIFLSNAKKVGIFHTEPTDYLTSDKLIKKYKMTHVPYLVFIDENGEVITNRGVVILRDNLQHLKKNMCVIEFIKNYS